MYIILRLLPDWYALFIDCVPEVIAKQDFELATLLKMFFKKSKAKKDNDTLLLENQNLKYKIRMDELLLENQKLIEENEKLKEQRKIILEDRSCFLNKWIKYSTCLGDARSKIRKLEEDLETERSLSSKLDMKMRLGDSHE